MKLWLTPEEQQSKRLRGAIGSEASTGVLSPPERWQSSAYTIISERNLKIERLLRPRSPLWRLRSWQTLLAFLFLVVLARLYYLQIYKGNQLFHEATVQRQQNNLLVHTRHYH